MADGYAKMTIRNGEQELDLGFSKQVSLERLESLIKESPLAKRLNLIGDRWTLELSSKPLVVERHRPLGDYPVGDGDVLEVKVSG